MAGLKNRWGSSSRPPRSGGVVRLGVDIGQAHDFTALIIGEEARRDDGLHYLVRSIERTRGIPYPAIADRISEVMANLKQRSAQRKTSGEGGYCLELLVDATGVGRPVVDLLRERGLHPISVVLTGGDNVTEQDGDRVSMAKSYLVSRLRVLLQSGRLELPTTAQAIEADILVKELQDYRLDFTPAGNATFNARSGKHDDLVIAVGLSTGYEMPRPKGKIVAFGKATNTNDW